MEDHELFVLALAKEGERYVFTFDRPSVPLLVAVLEGFAADPELDFTWADAELLKARIPAEWRVPL